MSNLMERRNFLKKSLLTAGALGLGKYAYADNPPPVAGRHPSELPMPENVSNRDVPHFEAMRTPALVAYHRDSRDSAIWIRWKNEIVTCYRAEALQKYPYFYPLNALNSGLSLTTETGMPYPHHRSVFFGLDRVSHGESMHNFWQNNPDRDRIVSTKLELGECTEKSVEFFNDCLWVPFQKEPIIADKRRFVLTILNDESYTLDCYFELTALSDDVVFNRTNHGLFGARLANDLTVNAGGVMINSEGEQRERGTHDKPARWMATYGKRFGRTDGLVEGLAIMTPPYTRAPFDKDIWFTRNYGNISPMPFNVFDREETLSFPKNDVLKLAYRLVTYTSVPTNSFLNTQWDEFTALSEGKRS
ncbi:MAG: PmoA family protein [Dysgonamonadaceae bacterium]|jgi:hypothetical protein|nr:PmoA family protein [Dysgonamonadaceae bacterium]